MFLLGCLGVNQGRKLSSVAVWCLCFLSYTIFGCLQWSCLLHSGYIPCMLNGHHVYVHCLLILSIFQVSCPCSFHWLLLQFLTEKLGNNKLSINRVYVGTVRSCHAPPCPLERDLHCPLAAIPMALISLTPSIHLTPTTGSKPQCNSPKHSQATQL